MTTNKELAEAPKSANSVESFISQAISQNVPVETLERLLAMRTQIKGELAREAYFKALAKFQSQCPTIKKKKAGARTKSGQVAYYYAPLESIVEQVKNLLEKNGFSYSVETIMEKNTVKAIMNVYHIDGHSTSSSVEVPLVSGTSVMSAPQMTASALTYAKRYVFCNAFGILTGDDDNDAVPIHEEKVHPDLNGKAEETQKKQKIKTLLTDLGYTPKSKEEWEERVKALTSCELKSENYDEIIEKLGIIKSEA